MALNSHIQSPKTGEIADVHSPGTHPNGLVVSTQSLITYDNQAKFFTNPLYGIDMNLQVGFGGSPEIVYQENTEWTAAAISGTWDFSSPGGGAIAPYAGTVCIDATATVDTNTAQLSRGSTINLTDYVSITGHIALSSWDDRGTKGIQISGWASGIQVGILADLRNYIDINILNTWLTFTIPLSDMNLDGQTIDTIRITTVDIGPGTPPDYYLDNIQIEEIDTSGSSISPATFCIKPDIGTWYYCHKMTVIIADNYDITYANSTVPALAYNQILGVASLPNGLLYRRIIDGETTDSYIIKNLSNFLQFPSSQIASLMSDSSNNTFITIDYNYAEPVLLKSETQDEICITVSDDLSGLDILRISMGGRKEIRS